MKFFLPNLLSLIRVPLAFLFFFGGTNERWIAVLVAALSDFLDGFLARKWGVSSKWGALLDPIGDKVFAGVVFSTLFVEGKLGLPLFLSLFTREAALLLDFILQVVRGTKIQVASFFWGKAMTFFQFLLILLTLSGIDAGQIPPGFFVLVGSLCLYELLKRDGGIKEVLTSKRSP